MADDVNALAQEYFDYLLTAWPTWGHMMGNYEHADLFDDASRAGEDEEIADAAASSPTAPRRSPSTGSRPRTGSRARCSSSTAGATPTSSTPGFDGVRRRPDLRHRSRACPVRMPKFPIPNADVAEAMIAEVPRHREELPGHGDRLLEGVARDRTPAAFAVDDTVAQIDRWLATPIDEDPLLHTAEPTGVADPDAWRARLREVVETDVRPAMAALPRHDPRPRPAARPRRRPRRARAGSPTATTPTTG